MKNVLQSDELKIKILRALDNGKSHTFYSLRKITKSSYDTLKPNCNFLRIMGLIEIFGITKNESATGTPYNAIKITKEGRKLLKRL